MGRVGMRRVAVISSLSMMLLLWSIMGVILRVRADVGMVVGRYPSGRVMVR